MLTDSEIGKIKAFLGERWIVAVGKARGGRLAIRNSTEMSVLQKKSVAYDSSVAVGRVVLFEEIDFRTTGVIRKQKVA